MTQPFASQGKQVLKRGKHFADACDDEAARAIAVMFNRGVPGCETPIEDVLLLQRVLAR